MNRSYVLKGDICYSKTPETLETMEQGVLVCEEGLSAGVFQTLPERYQGLPVADYGQNLILPGLVDLHAHAPQYDFRALGMDLELLAWLDTHTFPCEARYQSIEYAAKAYESFVADVKKGPNTRACVFATIHVPATKILMDQLEASGLVTMVGKVNMDRNSYEGLQEAGAARSEEDTVAWLESCHYGNTAPILTPRFIPSCSDDLMSRLKVIQQTYALPVQSHLSENKGECEWVRALSPMSKFYGEAYHRFGLFGQDVPTIMAHCVWSDEQEMALMRRNQVFVAHCPQSNMNLASGIAPVRQFLRQGINVGLGSDMAAGCHTSIFRAISDAVQTSKLRWRLINEQDTPLSLYEAFYLSTMGGGKFFGKVGSFEAGYEFDALVVEDASLGAPIPLTMGERLARVVYLSDDRHIKAKYVRGASIL